MFQAAETPHSNPRGVLDEHIAFLRARAVEMGDLVALAVTRSVISLVEYEQRVATEVIAGDAAINALHRRVRDLALAAIVRHQPVARDLREIVGLLEMASELERMGDHAATIARIARTTVGVPWRDVRADLCALADRRTADAGGDGDQGEPGAVRVAGAPRRRRRPPSPTLAAGPARGLRPVAGPTAPPRLRAPGERRTSLPPPR
jgi:hypothetical protein